MRRRQDVDELGEPNSGRIHEYLEQGPRRRTHLPEPAHVTTHLLIGSCEFKLGENPNPRTRILLVERDLLVRAGLVALVNSWRGFQVVAEARTEKDALAQRQVSPDVVLVSLAGIADIAMVVQLSSAFGADRLVVLLGHQAEEFRFQIGQVAHRVLMKRTHPRTLRKAINEIPVRIDTARSHNPLSIDRQDHGARR